jgi:hypothetical protein
MDDALPFFALAAFGCSVALVIWVAGRVWLRAKEIERATPPALDSHAADNARILTQIEVRLRCLEQSADATAIEVERVLEAQRFAARALAAHQTPPTTAGASTGLHPNHNANERGLAR